MFGLWIKPQTNDFHEFVLIVLYFVAIGSCTADGGLLQSTVSGVNLYKEFACRSKLSKWLQRQELKLTTRITERNPTMCEVT